MTTQKEMFPEETAPEVSGELEESSAEGKELATSEPDNPRLQVKQIPPADRVIYHAMKHNAFMECRTALEQATRLYRENKDVSKAARLAEAVQGFQRNLVQLAESLEDGLDPAKVGAALDVLMADHLERQIMAVASEFQRLYGGEADAKTLEKAFKSIGKRLVVEHRELRKNVGALVGAK